MKHLVAALFFLFPLQAFSQGLEVVRTLPITATAIATDNLGNLYTVKGDVLDKRNAQGELRNSYNNKSYGQISYVDATNPLRVVVFYRDLGQVAFLDNTLSDHAASIPLSQLGFDQAAAVCSSANNGIWLYDPSSQQLIWINQQGEVGKRSGNMSQQLALELQPNFLLERNNWVYLNDPNHGIFVFDIFGTYYKTIPFKGLAGFEVDRDVLYFITKGVLHGYDMKLGNEATMPLPPGDIESFGYADKRFFFRLKNTVLVCRQVN